MVNRILICWEEMCGMSDISGGFDWFSRRVLGCQSSALEWLTN